MDGELMKKSNQQRFVSLPMVYRYMNDLFMHIGGVFQAEFRHEIDKSCKERIMLAVTHVNGCRLCSYAHAKIALEVGIDSDEITGILDGEFHDVPEEQYVAILFAEHYAETMGSPSDKSVSRLLTYYGRQKASAVIANIRMIMVGNVYGNVLTAFWDRLRGTPIPGSNVLREVTIILSIIPFTLFLGTKRLLYTLLPPYRKYPDRVLEAGMKLSPDNLF